MPSDISRPRVGRRADVRLSGHMLKSPAGKVKMGTTVFRSMAAIHLLLHRRLHKQMSHTKENVKFKKKKGTKNTFLYTGLKKSFQKSQISVT